MTKNNQTQTVIRYRRKPTIFGWIFLGLVAVTGLQFLGLVPLTHLQEQNEYFWGTSPEQAKYVRDRVYKDLCPEWRDQNWFGRYVTHRDTKWCANYLDKL